MARVCAARIPPLGCEAFSVQEIMDLVFTAGQYTRLEMALNSFGVQPESGVPGFDLDL